MTSLCVGVCVCVCVCHSVGTGWVPKGSTTPVTLCNSCGIRYSKEMYCSYCNYIYMADEDWNTNKWIGCDTCTKWIHKKCEEEHLGYIIDAKDFYMCPSCRENDPKAAKKTIKKAKKRMENDNNDDDDDDDDIGDDDDDDQDDDDDDDDIDDNAV